MHKYDVKILIVKNRNINRIKERFQIIFDFLLKKMILYTSETTEARRQIFFTHYKNSKNITRNAKTQNLSKKCKNRNKMNVETFSKQPQQCGRTCV